MNKTLVCFFMLITAFSEKYSDKCGAERLYTKDDKANICYSQWRFRADSTTYVPCTPKVEKSIKEHKVCFE